MLYALDIETTGLDRFKDSILCIGVWNPDESRAFKSTDEFRIWLSSNPTARFVAHNGAFDFNFLRHFGIDLSSSWDFDTQTMSSLLVPAPLEKEGSLKRNLGLEFLSKTLLGLNDYKLDRTRMSEYSWEELSAYNTEDCRRTYLLLEYLLNQFNEADFAFCTKFLMPVTKLAAELEYNGILVDVKGLTALKEVISKERDAALKELNDAAKPAILAYRALQISEVKKNYSEACANYVASKPGRDPQKAAARYSALCEKALQKIEEFNWASPTQVKWLLKDYYGLNIANERTDEESTGVAVLKSLNHPIATAMLKFRELDKLLGTCIPALLDNIKPDGRVHGRYNVGGTRTGRLSSSGPNLQQVPGRLHKYVISRPGHSLVVFDAAQIEPRLLAHASGEDSLLEAFRAGHDIYSMFAKLIFNLSAPLDTFKKNFPSERGVGKTGGLSVIYGTGPRKFMEMVLKSADYKLTYKKAKQLVDGFRASMPKVQALKDLLEREAANQKKIYNLMGRPFYIETNDDLYMKTLNSFIQGSASDLIAYSFTKLWEKWPFIIPLMIVHDEVVFEIPDEMVDFCNKNLVQIVTTELEKEFNLQVPLKIEYKIAKEWGKP